MDLDQSGSRRRARALLASISVGVVAVLSAVAVTVWMNSRPDIGAQESGPTGTHASADLTWAPVGGVQLPFSTTEGPLSPATGRRFSDRPAGAALAAVHLLIRTSATSGPPVFGPALVDQITGSNADAMRRTVPQQYEQLRDRAASVPDGDAEVLGFRQISFQPSSATAEVFLSSPGLASTGQVVGFKVQLQWLDGDWRLVAPPNGDWGTVATSYDAPPADLTDYRDLRR